MPRGALALGLVLLLAGAGAWFVPFLLEERRALASAASPEPPGRPKALIGLDAGQELCLDPVVVDSRSEEARFGVRHRAPEGPPLVFTLSTPEGEQSVPVPGGYAPDSAIAVALDAPASEALATACIENAGESRVSLRGTAETEDLSEPRPQVERGDEGLEENVTLAFHEREESTLLARVPLMIERMALFRPAIVGEWLLWSLLVLVLVGVPGGCLWALQRAMRSDSAAR